MQLLPSRSRTLRAAPRLSAGRGLRFGAAALVAAALTLTGCASGGSTDSAAPEVELVDTGAELDQVTVAFPGSLANLYIGQESGILNYNLAATVQEGLVAQDPSGAVVPALAESWETPDDTTYVFTLREDAKFQNGDPVTPEDVVFSLERANDPEASPGIYYYLTNLDSAKKTGDREVTITSKAPDATFLVSLSNAGALVVTQQKFWEEAAGNVGTSDSLIMGTGPYQVTEFQPDSHVLLERVDTWWGGTPKAKSIRVNFIPDANTRLAAAQKGDIDIAFNVPINQAAEWGKIDGMRVESMNDLSYVGLLFDQNVAPFDDVDVRTAIAQSIDRAAISEKLLRGYGEAATAIMTPESLSGAYTGDEARAALAEVPQHDYDIEAAKQLIAGTDAEGLKTELTYPNTGPQLGIAAQAIAESLGEIGIELAVREVPIEEWLATIGDGEHGLGFMWYFSTTGDPAEINSYLVGPGNPNGFESDEAAALIAEANALTEPKARAEKLIELETLNAEQAVNAPIWWGKSVTGFSNTVGITDYGPYTFTGPWGAQLFAAEAK
ncbi:ABC transporter substrate-binding protein [Leucobacter luti]|uniref:Peptide/nickel transport system substrate-binding protein n=1 Tax=Leucobacter luti TaxID=340320 RepID=A0A4Q7U4A2_9MICO|nr:ABC transporter substrate-binding protein [Leucobacter luti]MBL3700656.1 ABC transporter substrate-binding protein [Leucobacter luti]RZT68504.1 peptide/nickel transport system substrate-binding protein [Leucobacter luti]